MPYFCRIAGCQNLLFGRATDFCNDEHRVLFHSRARDIGHRVLRNDILQRLIDMPFSAREERALRRLFRGPRPPVPPVIDLGAMTCQERLGALCRAAERFGVIKI